MKILLFGKNGQVGWELQRSLQPLGQVLALESNSEEYCGNLENLDGISGTIQKIKPDVIVNAAAYTAVDKAESESSLARTVNALAPGVIAEEAGKQNSLFIHYSTDYVFSGEGDEYRKETDPVEPINVYGQTKLEGERLIQKSGCRHIILRTSWVFGARGKNFMKTIINLAKERDSISVINDQFGAPTGAELIADITSHIIPGAMEDANKSGLYHLVAGGCTTWFDYAKCIISCAQEFGISLKTSHDAIKAISAEAFPVAARRPGNSRLNTDKLQNTFKLRLPDWQTGVQRTLSEIMEKIF